MKRSGVQDQRFPPEARLRTRAEFDRVFTFGRSVADRRFVLYSRENELGWSRLGLVVGRKVGGAVQRNRIKRLLREAFRLSKSELPTGQDLVVVVRGREDAPELAGVRESLLTLAQRSLRAPARARPARRRKR
jgi:ribonuclease P protein component